MRYDCVAGYHLNYLTCGIAKFNLLLGEKMGVPHHNLYDDRLADRAYPILSVKLAEFTDEDLAALPAWMERWKAKNGYSLFLHGYDGTELEQALVRDANEVYCGNIELYSILKPLNERTEALWCPGMNMSQKVFEKTDISVLSFGMAHKLRTEKYYRLKDLLEATGKSYAIYLSTALHEGTAFDESFIAVFQEMQEIFGDRVYFLGYMSDQAVHNYLMQADFFAAFFTSGVRANNTSVNAALEAGRAVITNLDAFSPAELEHMKNVIDITQCEALPTDEPTLAAIRKEAQAVGTTSLSWDRLIARLAG